MKNNNKRINLLALILMFASIFFTSKLSAQDCQGALFTDSAGIVVIDLELIMPGDQWVIAKSESGYIGEHYFRYLGPNDFNSPGARGIINIPIKIDQTGDYHFRWHSKITFGNEATEHNDSWLRFPDASDFYAKKGGNLFNQIPLWKELPEMVG